MIFGTRKIAEPIIVPTATFVASSKPSLRGKSSELVAGAGVLIRASITIAWLPEGLRLLPDGIPELGLVAEEGLVIENDR